MWRSTEDRGGPPVAELLGASGAYRVISFILLRGA